MVDFPPMTDKAAEAFDDYIDLPKRSLRILASNYVKQKRYKSDTTAFNQLAKWSREFEWQSRIVSAVAERSRAKLERANELDADTFLQSSEKLNNAIKDANEPRDIVTIRESVRKADPKTTVDVTHSGTIKHAHHDMSQFTDEEIDTLAEIAKRQKVAQ